MPISRKLSLWVVLQVVLVCSLTVFSGVAQAEGAGPGWVLSVNTSPTNLVPGSQGLIDIHLYNIGAQSSNGTVTVTDVLPPGLTATEVNHVPFFGHYDTNGENDPWHCSIVGKGREASCTRTVPVPPGNVVQLPSEETNGYDEVSADRLGVTVEVASGAARRETNEVTVTGGGAPPATTSAPVVVSSSLPGFGFGGYHVWASNANGTFDTQAGSHPYELTVGFNMNDYEKNPDNERNIAVNVPPGLVGDPTAVPQCSRQAFDVHECPDASQIGIDKPELTPESATPTFGLEPEIPVYNLVPPKGMPAQFGFTIVGINTFLDAGVRTGGDNGITEHVNNITDGYDVADNSIDAVGCAGRSEP